MLRAKFGLLILVAIVLGAMLITHTPTWFNGPFYWRWAWRNLPAAPLYPLMLAAAVPLLAAQFLHRDRRVQRILAILLLTLNSFGLRIASVYSRADMGRLDTITTIVQEPHMSSYYADAIPMTRLSLRECVTVYPDYLGMMHLHTQSKPPGPLLYWFILIKWMGANQTTAMFGGLLLGVIAAMSVPATYLMLSHLLRDREAAFAGASFLALCPGFVLFFPMFDPTYILLSAALIATWSLAIETSRIIYPILFGVALAATVLIAFNVLVIGIFLAMLIFLPRQRNWKQQTSIAVKQGVVALCAAVAALALLYMVIGYDPVATFRSAWTNQHALLAQHANERPYPETILFDLTDFALGSGWISVLLVGFYLFRRHSGTETRRQLPLVLVALIQIGVVAVTGLLQSETARVWNFMLPLLMIPIALELRDWPKWARAGCYVLLALLTAAIYQNMSFLY